MRRGREEKKAIGDSVPHAHGPLADGIAEFDQKSCLQLMSKENKLPQGWECYFSKHLQE